MIETKQHRAQIHCALIIGHTKSRAGATNPTNGISEFEFNSRMTERIQFHLRENSGVRITIVKRKTYKRLPQEINALKPDFCLGLHCNAFNRKASGTQVLYYYLSHTSKALAEALQSSSVDCLQLRDRGVVGVKDGGRGAHLLKNTNASCIIADTFFIDNDSDLKRAHERFENLARSYARFVAGASALLSLPEY